LPNANGNGTNGPANTFNGFGFGGPGGGGGGGSPGGGAAASSGLPPTSGSNNGGGGGGGGGGGSASTGTSTTFTQGYNSGQGSIIFTYTLIVPFSQSLIFA
jgi:hypothetical protein